MICSQSGWAWLVFFFFFLFHSILGSIYRGKGDEGSVVMTTYSHCMGCAGGNAFSIWTAGTERDIEPPFLSGGWNYQWQQMPGGQDVGGGILPGGKDPQEKKSDGQRGLGFYFSQRGSAGIPARVELRVKHFLAISIIVHWYCETILV